MFVIQFPGRERERERKNSEMHLCNGLQCVLCVFNGKSSQYSVFSSPSVENLFRFSYAVDNNLEFCENEKK